MKRANRIITGLAFFAMSFSVLVGCNNTTKLPTNSYEKVKFAFNGVEKSLKAKKVNKKSLGANKLSRLGGTDTENALNTIYSLYEENDKSNEGLDELEYNAPPMIQFQYIKSVLEKVGSGYSFGTKYYDTITGDMYLNVETGLKEEKDQYKYNYTFGLAIDINIDDNDLITADVSFDIKLAKGSETMNTKWYVAIELDYDMNNSSPNYTMTMVTENNEKELPYYGHHTYEYDYVEVKNSAINEWRKFCMSISSRLVKDNAHPNFESYVNEGALYKIDATSWFKNGALYKNKRPREAGNEAITVANALYTGLGLNAGEINADAFFNKAGTQNSTIKTIYNDFSKTSGDDIIYNLVTKDDDSEQNNDKTIASIKALNRNAERGLDGYNVGDLTFGELIADFTDVNGERVLVDLYYANEHDGLLDKITDYGSLLYAFKLVNYDKGSIVDLFDKVSDGYTKVMEVYGLTANDLTDEFEIVLIDQAKNVNGKIRYRYSGEKPDDYVKPTFPDELKNMGVPEYDGDRIEYGDSDFMKEPYTLEIKNTDGDEASNYIKKLNGSGFFYFNETHNYQKDMGENILAIEIDDHDINNHRVILKAYHMEKTGGGEGGEGGEGGGQEEPPATTYVSIVGEFNGWSIELGYVDLYEAGENVYRLKEFDLNEGEGFKIVINHTWGERGGYGYSEIPDVPKYNDYLTGGHENCIVAVRSIKLSLQVRLNGDMVTILPENIRPM